MIVSNNINLHDVLRELIFLLDYTGEDNWSSTFKALQEQYNAANSSDERKIVLSKIIQLYGGMGSFSDLVLYNDGGPLIEANNALDLLRTRLFDVIVNLR